MRFSSIIEKKYLELNEQGPGDIMPGMPPTGAVAPDASAAMQQPVPPAPAPAPESEGPKPLTAEGEVFLVRLLRKALFMNPGDLDEKLLKDLPDINEKNATEVLGSIVEIMKKYSNSIEVNTEPK